MFQFRGKKLQSYRQGWEDARAAAGYPNALFHDTRRAAVRNMDRAGVRRADARQITGHRTESVYVRYDIATEKGAFEAAEKLRKFYAEQEARKIGDQMGIEPAATGAGDILGIDRKSLN